LSASTIVTDASCEYTTLRCTVMPLDPDLYYGRRERIAVSHMGQCRAGFGGAQLDVERVRLPRIASRSMFRVARPEVSVPLDGGSTSRFALRATEIGFS
jgi:hypothetical protein